jgi:L-2,4-diaminobutyric acid acetyltransferase
MDSAPRAKDVVNFFSPSELRLRRPSPKDAAGVWRLVRADEALDDNSPYAYLLLCSDFAGEGIVADGVSGLAGFVAGYRPPRTPHVQFVWQVCVAPGERGRGLAGRMLRELLRRAAAEGVRELRATVTPGNAASLALFRGLARDLAAPLRERVRFDAALFPCAHDEEVELAIGPIDPARLRAVENP